MKSNNYYENRSCLRPYLLGWGTKSCLKTGKNRSKRAANKGKTCLKVKKQGNLGTKDNHSSLFMGVTSYEICSNLSLFGKQQ